MSEENITLFDLLNLSIGTPQQGAVNFSALHALLHAVLRQLGVRELKIQWRNSHPGDADTGAPVGVSGSRHSGEEQLQIEGDRETEVQPGTELQERTASSSLAPSRFSGTPADGQSELRSRIQTCEDGVSKAMRLIHELHNQRDDLKEEVQELHHQQKMVGAQAETVAAVESCCHRVDAVEETLRSLRDTVQKYPDPEELSQCVTWDVMQSTLLSERENIQRELVSSGVVDLVKPTLSPFSCNFTSDTSTSSSTHPVQDSVRTTAPGPPEILTLQEATETSSVQTHPETGPVAAGTALSRKASGSERYSETVEALRNIGKLKEKFSKLEARVAALEEGKVDQTQLDQLREVVTNKGSEDVSNNLMDQLNQHRALIDGLMSDREKNVELVNDVQKAILQLQAECEKLHETTRCLHEDNRQKQSHIEELYKATEELEEKKADKQMVESEIKADKSALDSKVSRLQFDSATEQLNSMFHELLNKVTGQEQDWHKVVDKLSTEMECKLNRIELDSVKKQLEDRWKNIHQKLQAQGAPEHEDAAGIRKQLVDRFHCLSCDRPVVKHTPGPQLVTLPSTPGFPSHKSIRPFTVYALEQFRQHYRSLKPGTNRYNFDVANSGRRREQLQRSHAVMCRQIESAQRHLKRCSQDTTTDSPNQNQNQNQQGVQHERIAELTDYSHLAVSRSCGGSHTVTSAGQRRTGLQYMKHHGQPEVDGVIQSEEVDIIGLDGHIYRGRLNPSANRNTETKLPTISTKDGLCKIKDKAKCSPSHKPAASPEALHHLHSAKSAQCSRSASSSSGRDWPVSTLGCTSQSSIAQASAAAERSAEPQDDQQADL
ncbi:glutamine-rich protein 2 isoform X4 [Lates calcarifer]|uniref:Glutamine-rich protein 2 isoform X4 n=1 Tax=Lates calcarifer TaxID=8187 RepID=A0AAJ7LI07_LATCA|nr:glutamine-rich protein 2 isoform X4 [Lates calcarifer]